MRVDLYSLIHKAQRKHLFELSIKIGKIDFENNSQVSSLKEELKETVQDLREHTAHEETFIHPLFNKIGNQGDLIESEHHDLEIVLNDLEKSFTFDDQAVIYTEFNKFLAKYLLHIDYEEALQKSILWKHYDDKILMEVMNKFKASRSSRQAMKDLEFMFPSLNPQEKERILGSMK